MTALIIGSSKGIGKEIAIQLSYFGYDLILVSRKKDEIFDIEKRVKKGCSIEYYSFDLSREEECYQLLSLTEKRDDIEVFVHCAGFGDIGEIQKTDLKKEVEMIKLNDISCLILTKSFLLRFLEKNRGKVLLVASAASFGVAPYMGVYYATKSFVYSLAHSYYRELKDKKSKVTLSVLCPGPVRTSFQERANCKTAKDAFDPSKVACCAVKKFMKGKFEIVVGYKMKVAHVFSHLLPKRWISKILNKKSMIADWKD